MSIHNAPSVTYPLGQSRVHTWLLLGLLLAGLLTAMMWLRATWRLDLRITGMFLALIWAGCTAYVGCKRTPVGHLVWDGQIWCWESPGYQTGMAEQTVTVVADLQHFLLLRTENRAGATAWMWAEKIHLPERWLDFRRAVYSPHKAASRRVSSSASLGPVALNSDLHQRAGSA